MAGLGSATPSGFAPSGFHAEGAEADAENAEDPYFMRKVRRLGSFASGSCEWPAEVPEMGLIEWSITMDRGLWRPSGIAHAEDLQSCADATEESTKAAAQIR